MTLLCYPMTATPPSMQNTNFGLVGPRRQRHPLGPGELYTFGIAAGDFSLSANDDGSHAISLNVPTFCRTAQLCAYVTT